MSIDPGPPTIDTHPDFLEVAPKANRMSSVALDSDRVTFDVAVTMLELFCEMLEPSRKRVETSPE